MTRVLIVEDERLVGEMLAQYVASAPDRYEMTELIRSANDAELVCWRRRIDLVLMDVCTAQNASGLDAARRIRAQFPHTKIIIITSAPEYRFPERAREAGAESFWYKDASETELLSVMDRTMAGEHVYPDRTPEVGMGDATSYGFTPRELETLYWLVKVGSAKEIAKEMGIEVGTVQTNLNNLKNKTGCATKAELAVLAVENKLVLPKY